MIEMIRTSKPDENDLLIKQFSKYGRTNTGRGINPE